MLLEAKTGGEPQTCEKTKLSKRKHRCLLRMYQRQFRQPTLFFWQVRASSAAAAALGPN